MKPPKFSELPTEVTRSLGLMLVGQFISRKVEFGIGLYKSHGLSCKDANNATCEGHAKV